MDQALQCIQSQNSLWTFHSVVDFSGLQCGCLDEMIWIPSGALVNAQPPADTPHGRAFAHSLS